MYDDDEQEEDEVVNVYYVDEVIEEEEEEEPDITSEAFLAKGREDRAFVDAQAREYDERKQEKRKEVVRLKQSILAMKSSCAKKERELKTLSIAVEKDRYLETRARVVREREEATETAEEKHERVLADELKEIEIRNARESRAKQEESLTQEIKALKQSIDEAVRRVAMLEQEILRS